jgi:hypothetical protein
VPSIKRGAPLFTVAVATFQRDAKIEATLLSIARQTTFDFEVLVVSDGPASPELRAIVADFDERFQLHELPERTRSQSAPNNHAWANAQGTYLAYLGHDDIWHPEHLESLARVFDTHPSADFAISGALMIGPPGAVDQLTWLSGIFSTSEADPGLKHFFPPSSIAHRRITQLPIDEWPEPLSSRGPVDSSFLIHAATSGCEFFSTERVTVFKFNSALRYLSYLLPDDVEQHKALELCDHPAALHRFIDERVRLTQEQGTHMFLTHPDPKEFAAGEILRGYEQVRGISASISETMPLLTFVTQGVNQAPSGFDWHPHEGQGAHTWRWSGPSPRPRLVLGFTSPDAAQLTLHISRFSSAEIQDSLALLVSGEKNAFTLTVDPDTGATSLRATIRLRESSATVIELRMSHTISPQEIEAESADTRQLGLCLTGITLAPIGSRR